MTGLIRSTIEAARPILWAPNQPTPAPSGSRGTRRQPVIHGVQSHFHLGDRRQHLGVRSARSEKFFYFAHPRLQKAKCLKVETFTTLIIRVDEHVAEKNNSLLKRVEPKFEIISSCAFSSTARHYAPLLASSENLRNNRGSCTIVPPLRYFSKVRTHHVSLRMRGPRRAALPSTRSMRGSVARPIRDWASIITAAATSLPVLLDQAARMQQVLA